MSFDEHPDGDIHGERAAESEPHELSTFEKWWVMLSKVPYMSKREIAERAFCAGQSARQDQLDACRPYLKEGETVVDALERLSAAAEWRPIETAPRDGTNVLGWCGSYVDICRTEHKFEVGEVWMTDGCADFGGRESPTHWMPLPSAPTTKETT